MSGDLTSKTGVGEYCTVGPASEQVQKFMLIFEDKSRGMCIYSDEQEARTAFARAESNGWNCHLFGLLRRSDEPSALLLVPCPRCGGTGKLKPYKLEGDTEWRVADCPEKHVTAEPPEPEHVCDGGWACHFHDVKKAADETEATQVTTYEVGETSGVCKHCGHIAEDNRGRKNVCAPIKRAESENDG